MSEKVSLALRATDFGVALLVVYQEAEARQLWGTADSGQSAHKDTANAVDSSATEMTKTLLRTGWFSEILSRV